MCVCVCVKTMGDETLQGQKHLVKDTVGQHIFSDNDAYTSSKATLMMLQVCLFEYF